MCPEKEQQDGCTPWFGHRVGHKLKKLLSRFVTKKYLQRILFAKIFSDALKLSTLVRLATPNVARMEPCKNPTTLATVHHIDMVDQHNGSRGCNSKCVAWCSGS